MRDLEPGTPVGAGRYIVEALLGQGGMASVYRVRHARLGTPLALKVLTAASPDQRQRLLREGRAQASLRHTNVVSVVDVVEVDGLAALVMEFIDGPDLAHVLKRRRLGVERADDLMRGILAGVAAAHEAGFVHRDLKPGNILLAAQRSRPVPRVADFGLVKQLGDGADGATRTGAMMGTPAYMAPEQVRDAGRVDARADVFALGAIAYELFAGRRAFEGDDAFDILEAIVKGAHVPVAEAAPALGARLAAVIERALATDPAARFADAGAMESAWLHDAPALSLTGLWTGDALVSGSAGPERRPDVNDAPETFDAGSVASTTAATADPTGASSPTLAPDAAAPSRGRRVSRGLVAVAAAGLALAGLAGWWAWPAGEAVFTVDGAPVLFPGDASRQKRMERAWDILLQGDPARAKVELEPLMQERLIAPEIAMLARMTPMEPREALQVLQRVDPAALARETGSVVCVRHQTEQLARWAQGWPDDGGEGMERHALRGRQLRAWVDAHPSDLLAALCLREAENSTPEARWAWVGALDRADPDGATPGVVAEVVDALLLDGAVEDASARVARARALDPNSPTLLGLEGRVLMASSKPVEALQSIEAALQAEPARLDLRREAAKIAAGVADEGAFRRHMRLLLAEEWPQATRETSLFELKNTLLVEGRPSLLLDAMATMEHPAKVWHLTRMWLSLSLQPGMFTDAQRRAVADGYRKGLSPDESLTVAQLLQAQRGHAEAALLVATATGPVEPDARFDEEASALLATLRGDPEPILAYSNASYATSEAGVARYGLPPESLYGPACIRAFEHALAYRLVGREAEALDAFRVLTGPEACGGEHSWYRAQAAGQLALDAFQRGAPEQAEPYVALYQRLWPIAEDTMPIAQALAVYGVVTGPKRAAWEDQASGP